MRQRFEVVEPGHIFDVNVDGDVVPVDPAFDADGEWSGLGAS